MKDTKCRKFNTEVVKFLDKLMDVTVHGINIIDSSLENKTHEYALQAIRELLDAINLDSFYLILDSIDSGVKWEKARDASPISTEGGLKVSTIRSLYCEPRQGQISDKATK